MAAKTKSVLEQIYPQELYYGFLHEDGSKDIQTSADSTLTRSESILSDNGRQKDNYCLHQVSWDKPIPKALGNFTCYSDALGGLLPAVIVSGGTFAQYANIWHSWSGLTPGYLESHLDLPSWEDFNADCASRWRRAAAADLDLPTSLFELRDVRRIATSVTHIDQMIQSWFDAPNKVRAVLSRETLAGLTGSHLAYQYGIRPLQADIQALADGFQGAWRTGYNNLMATLDKPIAVRAQRSGLAGWDDSITWGGTNYLPGCWGYSRGISYVYSYRAVRTVTNPSGMAYDFNKYMQTKLGFDRPFYTLWNKTPWTFVVDMFVNIGKKLDEMSSTGDQLHVSIEKVCVSRKLTNRTLLWYRPPLTYQKIGSSYVQVQGTFGPEFLVGELRRRSYERFPHAVSQFTMVPELSGAWRYNIASLASLGIAQMLRVLSRPSITKRYLRERVGRGAVRAGSYDSHADIWNAY